MRKTLDELIEGQAELRAMMSSCEQYEKMLNKKIEDFLADYLGLPKDKPMSLLDVVAGTLKASEFLVKKED